MIEKLEAISEAWGIPFEDLLHAFSGGKDEEKRLEILHR